MRHSSKSGLILYKWAIPCKHIFFCTTTPGRNLSMSSKSLDLNNDWSNIFRYSLSSILNLAMVWSSTSDSAEKARKKKDLGFVVTCIFISVKIAAIKSGSNIKTYFQRTKTLLQYFKHTSHCKKRCHNLNITWGPPELFPSSIYRTRSLQNWSTKKRVSQNLFVRVLPVGIWNVFCFQTMMTLRWSTRNVSPPSFLLPPLLFIPC